MPGYQRTVGELREQAVLWWPTHLAEMESELSIIPLLVQTQERFINILKLSGQNPTQIFDVLNASRMAGNLFLKHLIVLSDFGGEQIQRINREFTNLFPGRFLEYAINGQTLRYQFNNMPIQATLNNNRLGIDGPSVRTALPMDELKKDLCIILLFGSTSLNAETAEVLSKCIVGSMLGDEEQIEKFVRQRYIFVSRITGGAEANTLGQVAQTYAVNYLRAHLPENYTVTRNGSIEGIPFDIVVENNRGSFAVEVSFQETTNSTIERKAGQAKSRHGILSGAGKFITYILDGAGNFQRRSALSTICANSDCTVAYSDDEFNYLITFIREQLG